MLFLLFFFFQAEDGIRDSSVTGVQTCALPISLATLLFYWGVLQRVVQGFAWVLRRTVGVGGPLGLGAAVHIFVGHIEAPLLIRPYLARLERGELFALMSCRMAGIARTVMVLYAALIGFVIPLALGDLL